MAAKIVHKNFVYLEKQGVVFGYVPKVACTNWKIALRRLQGFANYQDVEIAHDRERSGLRFLDPLDSKDIKILESPRIKKIAFVRNPYSRVLSAYLNKIDRFNKGSESPTEGNYWFTVYENIAAFSKSQTSHRSLAKLLQKTLKVNRKRDNSANVDFFTFLTWLKYPHTPAHLSQNEHWASQYQILQYHRIKFDFVGRFENLSRDANIALKMMDADFEFSPVNAAGHSTNASNVLDKYYGKREISLVNDLFHNDLEAFGYSRRFAPT